MITEQNNDSDSEKLFQCFDINGNPTIQTVSKAGEIYENGYKLNKYISTNGNVYVPYIKDVNCNKRVLFRLDFVMLCTFKGIHDFSAIEPVHIDNNILNCSLSNLGTRKRNELWKPVKINGIGDKYEISNNGRLRRVNDLKIVCGSIFKLGYRVATICDKKLTFHRMVGLTFIPNPNPDKFKNINHIDGDRSNNFDWNLEWCDQKLNSVHGAIYGNMGIMKIEEIDMIRELLLNPKYSGSPQKVYNEIKLKYPHITLAMIYAIKHNTAYRYSAKFNTSRIDFPKCDYSNISTTILDNIRDLLISNDFSPSKVYKLINQTYPEITLSIIKGIKSCRKEYLRSDKYDIEKLTEMFKSHKEKGKGVTKHMQGITNNPTDVLDLCRGLLLTKTFHGSPTALYKVLNHNKYPNLTASILNKLVYDNAKTSPYYRSNKYDLSEFFDRIKNRDYNAPTAELIGILINSYSSGSSDITDEAYDILLEEFIADNGESSRPYLRVKKSDVVNGFTQTLSKVYGTTEPMREGQDTYEQWFIRKGINPNAKIIIQPKFDGASIAVDKSGRFFTRGDYQNGESVDVTDLFKNHNIEKYMREAVDGVKFEAIMCHENFYAAGIDELKSYLKPLDVVNAIIHSRNSELSEYITLIPLRESIGGDEYVCSELKSISLTTTADDFETIQQFIVDKLNDGATVEYGGLHYSIDGVVVSVLGEDGETTHEIAIKILNDINETKLIDVKFQFGKTGKITPVAIVEPVQFCDGKRTVDHITVSTLDRVNELALRKGDSVRVMYNIVPYLLDTKHDGYERIQLPTHCPKCGAPFEYTSLKTVRCTNPVCQGRKLGSIIRYCEKMKMMGVGESTLNALFDNNLIRDIDDLYTLTSEQIQTLPGFKETSANNIIKSIRDNSDNVPVSRWLGALPFLDVDQKKWELVLTSVFGNDELRRGNAIKHIFSEAPEEFDNLLVQGIRGIGTATIKSMNEGFITNKDMFKRLIHFITFKSTTNVSNKGKVCLTGTRDKTVTEYLTKKGYQVSDSLTKDTVLVVRPDPMFESGKTKKAYDLGIKIITINEALGL
jgi:DNA ligase (NAD+)